MINSLKIFYLFELPFKIYIYKYYNVETRIEMQSQNAAKRINYRSAAKYCQMIHRGRENPL